MDLYSQTSYELSKRLTLRYSTSFGMSSRLFARDVRPHIYAVYGLVRIADEIVDTYSGDDAAELLDELERQTEQAMQSSYSSNPIVHAFAVSTQRYGIDVKLTRPFFESMRQDLFKKVYTGQLYDKYIYGSAEVIGLMCLRIFTDGDSASYKELSPGARALGAAYQKINFLRDLRDDYRRLERVYFPGVDFETFSNKQKQMIEVDIEQDLMKALEAIQQLPKTAKTAVMLSYEYYRALFEKIQKADVDTIKQKRMRIPNSYKTLLLARRLLLR